MPTRPPTSSDLPKNWPPTLPYLTSLHYSPTLQPSHRLALQTQPIEPQIPILHISTLRSPSPNVKIVPIASATHPACGQAGLFAARDLQAGEFVLLYLGVVHAPLAGVRGDGVGDASTEACHGPATARGAAGDARDLEGAGRGKGTEQGKAWKRDAHGDSDYDLSLDRESGLGIDAAAMGNEARFINDYRGVRERPNAEFRECWVEGTKRGVGGRGMGVWILPVGKQGRERGKRKAIGVVRKGDEILVSYGRGFWGPRRVEEGVWRGGEAGV